MDSPCGEEDKPPRDLESTPILTVTLPIRIGPVAPLVTGGNIKHPREQAFAHKYDYLRGAGFTAFGFRDFGGLKDLEVEMRHLSGPTAKANGISLMASMPWSHPSHYDLVPDGKRPKAAAFVLAQEALYHREFGAESFTFIGAPKDLISAEQNLNILAMARDFVKAQAPDLSLHLANAPTPTWHDHTVEELLATCKSVGFVPDLYAPALHSKGMRDKADWVKVVRQLQPESIVYLAGYEAQDGRIRSHTVIGFDATVEAHNREEAWQGFVEAALTWNKTILVEGGRNESSAIRIMLLALDHLGIAHADFHEGRTFKLKQFEPAKETQLTNMRLRPGKRDDEEAAEKPEPEATPRPPRPAKPKVPATPAAKAEPAARPEPPKVKRAATRPEPVRAKAAKAKTPVKTAKKTTLPAKKPAKKTAKKAAKRAK
jgi:hypothetical protein